MLWEYQYIYTEDNDCHSFNPPIGNSSAVHGRALKPLTHQWLTNAKYSTGLLQDMDQTSVNHLFSIAILPWVKHLTATIPLFFSSIHCTSSCFTTHKKNGMNVLFKDEHSITIYFLNFEKPGVSVLTSD